MKIPGHLYQFPARPAIFVASGEFSAKFYLACDGKIELLQEIKLPPRTEAREKQGFIASSAAKNFLGSVSHKGRYLEDLKKKFIRQVISALVEIDKKRKISEIHLFVPPYVMKRIIQKSRIPIRNKVKTQIGLELNRFNPLTMIKILMQEEEKARKPL